MRLTKEEWNKLDELLAKHLECGGYYDFVEILKDFIKKFVDLKNIERTVDRREDLKEVFDLIYALAAWKGSEKSERDVCVVCGHSLSSHVDEGDGWRCHSLGPDLKQCECFLRKRKDLGEVDLNYYSLGRRLEEALKDD